MSIFLEHSILESVYSILNERMLGISNWSTIKSAFYSYL